MGAWSEAVYSAAPRAVQELLLTCEGMRLHSLRYNRVFWRAFSLLRSSERLTFKQLRQYQDERLKALICHSYGTVPYYRQLLDDLKLRPNDIEQVEDLTMLPVLQKEDVIRNKAKMLSSRFSKRYLVRAHTSGTSGTALQFWWTREGTAWESAFVWARRRDGVRLGDSFATFNGRHIVPVRQLRPPFWRHNLVSKQTLFSIYHMNRASLQSYVEQLNRSDYRYFVGYPSGIYVLAVFMLENGLELASPPGRVFTSSECLSPLERSAIERAFNTTVVDSYSNGEQSALITQCEFKNYHISHEYSVVELVPAYEDDDAIHAKVIGTGFLNWGMPFIRYDTGDCVVVPKTQVQCPCGRPGPIITSIEGRLDDFIITPEGNVVGRIDHVFKDTVRVKQCQILQHENGGLELLVVPRPGYDERDDELILHELRKRVGNTIDVRIRVVSSVPRGAGGKSRAVVSRYRPGRQWAPPGPPDFDAKWTSTSTCRTGSWEDKRL